MTPRSKDLIGGLLMLAIGAFALVQGRTYQIGTVTRMGPGFFPTAVGVVMALSGLALAGSAVLARASAGGRSMTPEWRGWFCIILGVVAFVLCAHSLGMLPATFAIVFIAAVGDRQNTLPHALALALGMVLVAFVVFWWALKIQLPLFAWRWA